ncbi:acetyl-CoA carboxylase biotin carboxyl carrier protein subunit [bacterium]|nr:acetyl-CoA carboxylase biotin carboxyl carrier protein subunit [bacterium]
MRLKLKDNSGVHEFDVNRKGDLLSLKCDDQSLDLIINEQPNAGYIIKQDEKIIRCHAVRVKDDIFVHIAGKTWNFKDVTHDDVTAGSTDGGDDNRVVAPMPGSVIKLLVKEGDEVKRDQPIVIVEAMKMENEVRAMMNGVVDKVHVEAGQQVGFGEIMIELAPLGETGEGKATE